MKAIATARKKMQNNQEEENSMYQDNSEYEYKIVRSLGPIFSNKESFDKIIAEEKENGWEMVEMFDAARVRFRRKKSLRNSISYSKIDPYRTYIPYEIPNPYVISFFIFILISTTLLGFGFWLLLNFYYR
jgi:hypothetical protein